MRNWLNKVERKLYRFNIPPFMRYIVFAMAGVFLLDLFLDISTAYSARDINLMGYLRLDIAQILRGQVWRLVTWLVVPTTDSLLWIIVSLYFYYMIGTALESRWGVRRFLIYFAVGALANIAAAFIVYLLHGYGYGTNTYLYYSLFFAFAALYPDVQFTLFFILPLRAKWLALINLVFFATAILFGGAVMRAAAIASLVNVALFFWQDIYTACRQAYTRWQRRQAFKR